MKKQLPPIVITTIFPPNRVIKEYVKLGANLIIIGDKKTPLDWQSKNCLYISPADQAKKFPVLSSLIPWNHYGRKNLGYLTAMETSDSFIETDDDNYPQKNYPNFKLKEIETTSITSKSGVCNVYTLFLHSGYRGTLWPRGYPLEKILDKENLVFKKIKKIHYIQQSLIDGDTDVDAIYRLTNGKNIKFKRSGSFSMAKKTYAPINTQNTLWMKEAFLLCYLPVYATFRSCDIYKGWIAQRLLWEINSSVLFLPPSVIQKRNPHNYLKDFESEVPLFLQTSEFLKLLNTVKLSGSLDQKLYQIYEALVAAGFMDKRELPILKEWITAVKKIT